jgi:hypothetical protein
VRLPASGANHDVDLSLRQLRQVLRHRVGEREIDRHINVAECAVDDRALFRMLVDHAGHGGAV